MELKLADLIAEALAKAPNALTYDLSRKLATAFPDKALLESESCELDFEAYASEGHCYVKTRDGIHPEFESTWDYTDKCETTSVRNAWHEIEWQGYQLQAVTITYKGVHERDVTRVYLLADSQETTSAFFEAVCGWNAEISGEVLVFSGGWQKDRDLFDSIQSASLADLVLDGDLKDRIRDDLLSFFENEDTYRQYGVPWKRGVLFLGPPGNGKTHAIKALSNLLGMPCLYVKTFKAQYSTEHASIQSVFQRARASAPCILVLEDLDSLVTNANRSFFLNEMDGFASNRGILTIATTNHPDRLDPAILDRPSRFDRKYMFGLPNLECRRAYLSLRNDLLEASLQLQEGEIDELASLTDEFSYAYLKELFLSAMMYWISNCREARLFDVMKGQVDSLRSQMRSSPDNLSPIVEDYDFDEDDEE